MNSFLTISDFTDLQGGRFLVPSMGIGSCGQVTTSSSESLSPLSFISDSLLDPSSVIDLWMVSNSWLAMGIVLYLVILAAGIIVLVDVALFKIVSWGKQFLMLVEAISGLAFFSDGSGMVDVTCEFPSTAEGGVQLFLV